MTFHGVGVDFFWNCTFSYMLGIPSKNNDNHLSLLHVCAFLPTHMEHSDCLIILGFFFLSGSTRSFTEKAEGKEGNDGSCEKLQEA